MPAFRGDDPGALLLDVPPTRRVVYAAVLRHFHERTLRALLDDAIRRLERGERITFGSLALEGESLSVGDRLLERSALAAAGIDGENLSIRDAGWRKVVRAPLGEFGNPHVLLAILGLSDLLEGDTD